MWLIGKKILIQYYYSIPKKKLFLYLFKKKHFFKIDPEVTRKQFFVKYLFSMKYKMKSIKIHPKNKKKTNQNKTYFTHLIKGYFLLIKS